MGEGEDQEYVRKYYALRSKISAALEEVTRTDNKVKVELYKPSGKYYTEEDWIIPEGAIGPYDMEKSPDFRRISGGPVLIPAQEPWGFPFLFLGRESKSD